MQVNLRNERNSNLNFGKFYKISGHEGSLNKFRDKLKNDSYEFLSFIKKEPKQTVLYLITGKELDKFIDAMMKKTNFYKLRTKPEKVLKKMPKEYSLRKAISKFKEKNLI